MYVICGKCRDLTTDMSEAEEVEITEDAERFPDEEIEISEEDSIQRKTSADVFLLTGEDTVTYSSEVSERGYCGSISFH